MSYMRKIKSAICILVLFAIAITLPVQTGCNRSIPHDHKSQEKAVRYHCPMHPTYTSDRVGQCPICGMDLVPIEDEGGGAQKKEPEDKSRADVTITSERQQLIGVKTAVIAKGPAKMSIRAAGRVAFDPDLAVAQREYIEARRSGDAALTSAARKRLVLMGMGDEDIKGIAKRGRPQEELTLPKNDVLIYATIYEREIPFVKIGQSANIELPDGVPAGSGTIRAIDPVLDSKTRSARARIEVANPGGKLRPNMFVNATIQNDLGEKLLVPKSAVIDTGGGKIVFLVHDREHFMPREVVLGAEMAGDYIVEEGLSAGDTVATNALFLIDSESQLKAAVGGGGHKHD